MRVLLVFAEANMNPRMGVMYLASGLKAQGHETSIVNAARLGLKGLRNLLLDWRPRVVGFTAMTGEHVRLLELSRELKKNFSFLAVFGGPHATFCAEDLVADPGCDAACVGEGDAAFPEFCRRIEAGEEWWRSPNFVLLRDGVLCRNPVMPLLDNLNTLPMPDHDLMYLADPPQAQEGTKIFFSTRDCPCNCTYCFQSAYKKIYGGTSPVMRRRSPKAFVDEIVYVKERYPLTFAMINDDSFLLNPKDWFDEFCPDYKTRIGLPFSICARANLVTEERIAQLRDAGMAVVAMGVECGNEEIANSVLKRNLTKEQIRRAAQIIQRNGIFFRTLNLCGLPVPNAYKIDLETLMFNVELKPDWAWTSLLYPYPATEIRNYAQGLGLLAKDHVPLLQSNKRASVFTFSSPAEKRKIENLHKLFDLFVQHSWLRKHADFLCSLPLSSLYRLIYYIRYGYVWKFRMFPFRSPSREVWRYFIILLKLVRQ